MSKIVRYQGDVRAFASDAQGMERTVFGGTNQADDLTSQITASFLRGWGIVGASEHPSLEDFNAAMYAMSQFIAYQHQMGVPEWHAEQEYHIGSICTHNGESYQSLQNANIGSQPPSAKWTPVLTSKNGLANLGLGEGAPAIGVPFFWPSAAMPDTVIESWSGMVFLKFNGAKFSATDYPVLAKVFPSLVLPEARGDFIRIWDDGRGADSGRALLSWQAATSLSQFGGNYPEGSGHAIADYDGISAHQPGFSRFQYTSNSVGDGVNFVAVRPRNIAFNFLVRAK
ncbi:tail fiber protein [Escherichia coli]|uniref:tail fiber protein n=1 Tax=Escherichia coli TaxID=562 RepID=UPI002739AE94|nr:tail fiber protein [Escherichia coli]MDP4389817.1 tail fiber protein [Escherichia coli]MDP4418596.1 tail fiber protein [Escherichia coli]